MQKCRPLTDSAAYGVQYGGVWLEYHERIEFAERELSTVRYICDEVTAERDALLAEKLVLERKFKDSIASLTQTETDHLEAKQIVDKVREEQKDLARHCLASEAHTEWLEDQVKQLKLTKSIKDEEIASQQFRIDNLKSSIADGVAAQDSLKGTLAERDNEIATLKSLLKSRDEEILVQSRSIHSKDRQLAQLVKERNAFKDDLTDTQRALALARRTTAVNRKAESVKIHTVAAPSTCIEPKKEGACVVEETRSASVTSNTQPSRDSHDHSQSSAKSVLRRYKSSLHTRSCTSNISAADTASNSSVLLEDILMSVLTPESETNAISSPHDYHTVELEEPNGDTRNSINTSMDVVADAATHHGGSNDSILRCSTEHILTTPEATRKSPLTLSDATTDLAGIESLHLDEHDLDYINTILDTPGTAETVVKGRASSILAPADNMNTVNRHSDRSNEDSGVVQKALFAASPAPKRPNSTYVRTAGNTSTNCSKNGIYNKSGTVSVAANPWAVPTKPAVKGRSSITSTPTIATSLDNNINVVDMAAYIERERNYKSALYLLQEEVRLLRSQVAGFEAAKRSIRGTPKKKTGNIYSVQVV